MAGNGTMDKLKGSVKEGVGKLTGNEQTEAEGKADKTKGDAKNLVDKAKDKVSDVKDAVNKATN